MAVTCLLSDHIYEISGPFHILECWSMHCPVDCRWRSAEADHLFQLGEPSGNTPHPSGTLPFYSSTLLEVPDRDRFYHSPWCYSFLMYAQRFFTAKHNPGYLVQKPYKIIKITEHITLGSTNNMPQERMQKSCSSDGKHSNRWAPNSVQNTMTFLHASQLKTPYFLGQLRYGCRASNYGQLLPHFTWWYLTSQVFKCAYAHLVSTILQFKKIQNL